MAKRLSSWVFSMAGVRLICDVASRVDKVECLEFTYIANTDFQLLTKRFREVTLNTTVYIHLIVIT
jgi:hypothetical protein